VVVHCLRERGERDRTELSGGDRRGGLAVSDAAEKTGVSRQTLQAWLLLVPVFIARCAPPWIMMRRSGECAPDHTGGGQQHLFAIYNGGLQLGDLPHYVSRTQEPTWLSITTSKGVLTRGAS
jgi:hypothetical protein